MEKTLHFKRMAPTPILFYERHSSFLPEKHHGIGLKTMVPYVTKAGVPVWQQTPGSIAVCQSNGHRMPTEKVSFGSVGEAMENNKSLA